MLRIDKLFTDRPEMGRCAVAMRRMHKELTTEADPLNIKRIRRLMRVMGLEAAGPKPNLSKPQAGHTIYPYLLRGVAIERVNQVWSTDITDVPMSSSFLYLCRTGVPAVIDWYSRFILSWRLNNTLLADFCVDALQEALTKWGKPEIFNRADFHGLCKHGRIIFVIFLAPMYHRANPMDELITDCVQNQHFVFAFANFADIVVL